MFQGCKDQVLILECSRVLTRVGTTCWVLCACADYGECIFPHSSSLDTWLHIPHNLLSLSNFSGPIPLVNKSASMSSVGQYWRQMLPLLTCSRIKWYLMVKCFVLPWNWGFLAIDIAHWLSSNIRVGWGCGFFRSALSSRIQTASWAALESAIYSASAVDRATHVCFLLFHVTAVPPIWNKYPVVDL